MTGALAQWWVCAQWFSDLHEAVPVAVTATSKALVVHVDPFRGRPCWSGKIGLSTPCLLQVQLRDTQ